jgi:hypothetical protein
MAHQSSAAKVPSAWQRFTSVFREAHPIGRVPKFLKAHDTPSAAFHFRRFARTGVVFVPFMVGFCKSLFDLFQLASTLDQEKSEQSETKANVSFPLSSQLALHHESNDQCQQPGANAQTQKSKDGLAQDA